MYWYLHWRHWRRSIEHLAMKYGVHYNVCVYSYAGESYLQSALERQIDGVCMVITYSKSMDQPGKVANPARGQLNRGNE